jgi:hypothetical protein
MKVVSVSCLDALKPKSVIEKLPELVFIER